MWVLKPVVGVMESLSVPAATRSNYGTGESAFLRGFCDEVVDSSKMWVNILSMVDLKTECVADRY